MLTSYPVQVNRARVVAASFTLGAVLTVLTTNHIGRTLLISNTLDEDVTLTYNGSAWIDLPEVQGGGVDLFRVFIPSGVVIGALPISATPTAGWLSLSNI